MVPGCSLAAKLLKGSKRLSGCNNLLESKRAPRGVQGGSRGLPGAPYQKKKDLLEGLRGFVEGPAVLATSASDFAGLGNFPHLFSGPIRGCKGAYKGLSELMRGYKVSLLEAFECLLERC